MYACVLAQRRPRLADALTCRLLLQAKDKTVDIRVIRALLRLYASTGRANAELTALALAKALTLHPEPEFLQLLYMVPEKAYTPAIKALVEIDQLLQGAEWGRFWSAVEKAEVAPVLAKVAGFADAIREYIFGAVNRTYSRIDKQTFAEAVHLPAAAADAFAASHGATSEGQELVLPPMADNSDRKAAAKENNPVPLRKEEMASVVALLTR